MSAKMRKLLEILEDLRTIKQSFKFSVIANYTKYLDTIHTVLQRYGWDIVIYHGGLSASQRRNTELNFKTHRQGVLISTKAGGTGLNLVEATEVFMMTSSWNPKADERGEDRAHRIGQTKVVTVHRIEALKYQDRNGQMLPRSKTAS